MADTISFLPGPVNAADFGVVPGAADNTVALKLFFAYCRDGRRGIVPTGVINHSGIGLTRPISEK